MLEKDEKKPATANLKKKRNVKKTVVKWISN